MNQPSGVLTIPSSINGKPVTAIHSWAFDGSTGLTGLNLPSSLTEIGDFAFYSCTALQSVTVPAGVTSLGISAFDNCTLLQSVSLPSSLRSIARHAFYRCTKLASIIIPAGVTTIGEHAFDYCLDLASVSLPSTLISLGPYAFYDCRSLTAVTVPGVASVGDHAFASCDSLGNVTLGSGVTSIGNRAFYDCGLLKSVTFPASLRTIGEYAFYDCAALEQANIADGVTSIGRHAFANCSALSSVRLPPTMTSLGEYAFYRCRSLTEVAVPAVGGIGDYTFAYCDALARVTFASGIGSIGEYAFYDCPSLTAISIPSSVTVVGKYAFSNCTGLVSAAIAPGITRIAEGLFQQCSSLTTANIPSGVTSIGSYAFQGCSLLAAISMPSSVTSIGSQSFQDCSALSTVVISPSLTSIPPYAFDDCSNLTAIVIPSGVTTIGEWAFSGCTGATQLSIPSTVLSIGQYAFSYCRSLPGIEIPDSVTSIGQYAFYDCSSATFLRLPAALSGVPNYAFASCSSLTSVVFPASLLSIGERAFSNADSLVSLSLPFSLISIAAYAFNDCDRLQSIAFPSSVASIGNNAFYSCGLLERAEFAGNAPSLGSSAFAYSAKNFTIYYLPGAKDFTSPTWQGYATAAAVPTVFATGSLSLFSTTAGTASAAQSFTVSGSNLAGNVAITAPAGFEVSTGGGYGSNASLVPASGTLAATTVSVRVSASAQAGSPSGNMVVSSQGATSRNIPVSGTVAVPRVLDVTGSLSLFSTTVGTASAAQSFTVSGSNLAANVTITAPAGFEVSVGGAYGSSASLVPASGTLAATTVSVRVSASAQVGSPSGNVVISSQGTTSRNVATSATVASRPPPAIAITGTLLPFNSATGTPSAAQSFTVSGSNLAGNVTITAPAGFEVSAGGAYGSSASLVPASGTLAATAVSVRVSASAQVGSPSGKMSLSSAGATTRFIDLTATVQSSIPPAGIFVGNFSMQTTVAGSPQQAIDALGQISLNNAGTAFTLSSVLEGGVVRTKGSFDRAGLAQVVFTAPRSKLVRRLNLSYKPGDPHLTAAIKSLTGEILASFYCFPAAYHSISKPFTLAGLSVNSLVFSRQESSLPSPFGHGFATIKMGRDGSMALNGFLADNTKFTGSARLIETAPGAAAQAHLSVPLPPVRGLLWGVLQSELDTETQDLRVFSDAEAPLLWARPPSARAKLFPEGFLVPSDLRGRLWKGSRRVNVLTLDTSTASFSLSIGGNSYKLQGLWSPLNKPSWDGGLPRGSLWTLDPATGAIAGKIPQKAGGAAVSFRALLVSPGVEDGDGETLLHGGGYSIGGEGTLGVEISR